VSCNAPSNCYGIQTVKWFGIKAGAAAVAALP